MSLSKLTFGYPYNGTIDLNLDNDCYLLTNHTKLGNDFLSKASNNFTNSILYGLPAFMVECQDGYYYFIFEHGELTVCRADEGQCKHYYFGSAFNLFQTIYFELDAMKEDWAEAMKEDWAEPLKEAKKHICPLSKEVREATLEAVRKYGGNKFAK